MSQQNLFEAEAVTAEAVEQSAPVDRIMQAVGLSGLGGVEEMQRKLTENLKIHQAVIDFVNEHFHEGIDYGRAVDNASSKPVLLLPGAEKIVHCFDTHPEYETDKDTWEMLGKPTNTVFMICNIVDNKTGRIIGQGRGACTVGEKFGLQAARDVNGSVKIAKKRALVDAAKDAFMLSQRFTQDMEETKAFIDEKKCLYEAVQKMRSGIKSSLSDNEFIRHVCSQVIHQKSISTRKQLSMVNESISQYDFATGEKLQE
jgi:hypothetical protein